MPSTYNGAIAALKALLPAAVNIASSTNASPIVVTTSTAHGCTTDDTVGIFGHLVNTAANGSWEVVVLSATTLELVGSTGNGVGVATGVLRNLAFGSQVTIPSAGDPRKVASVNPAFEALADRCSLLLYLLSFAQHVHAGGAVEFESGSALLFDAATIIISTDPTAWNGPLRIVNGSRFSWFTGTIAEWESGANLDMYGTLTVKSGGVLDMASGSTVDVHTKVELHASTDPDGVGGLQVDGGATIDGKAGSIVNLAGTTTVTGSGQFSMQGNATVSGTTVFTGASTVDHAGNENYAGVTIAMDSATTNADASTITRSGPTIHSGNNGYSGGRQILRFAVDGDQSINSNEQEFVALEGVGTLTTDRTYTIHPPPTAVRVIVTVSARATARNGHHLILKDSHGATIDTLQGSFGSNFEWMDLLYNVVSDSFEVVRAGGM